nr:5-oxoprolinase subunit PxpB [Methylobacterium sp. BTF04]
MLWCGDSALTVEFGDVIDAGANAQVLALDDRLRVAAMPVIVETVPTYRSLTIHLDPVRLNPNALEAAVRKLAENTIPERPPARIWRVPVVYGGEYGIDLVDVARHHGLAPETLVARHSAPEYRVVMIGFLPGYAYLDGLDPGLALSRRTSPRASTPAGTISIGGVQALIASIAAPSGWHLLGRTPVRSFMPGRDPVFLFQPGDGIRFEPTAPSCWDALDKAAAAGEPVAERVDA